MKKDVLLFSTPAARNRNHLRKKNKNQSCQRRILFNSQKQDCDVSVSSLETLKVSHVKKAAHVELKLSSVERLKSFRKIPSIVKNGVFRKCPRRTSQLKALPRSESLIYSLPSQLQEIDIIMKDSFHDTDCLSLRSLNILSEERDTASVESDISIEPLTCELQKRDKATKENFYCDGFDCLSLGSSEMSSKEIVAEMLFTPRINQCSHIVLEGFIPNGLDRLAVRMNLNASLIKWKEKNPPETTNHGCSVDEELYVIDEAKHLYAIHQTSISYLEGGHFLDALNIFRRIYWTQKKKYGDEHPLVGSALHNLGTVQLWSGYLEHSIASFRQASKVRYEAFHTDHTDLAVSLTKLGMALFAMNQHFEAIEAFERACEIIPSELSKAKIMNSLGCAYFQEKKLCKALSSFARAFEIQRKSLLETDDREDMVFETSTTLTNMGRTYMGLGHPDMAHLVFKEALILQKCVFPESSKIISTSMANIECAKLCKINKEKEKET